MFKQEMKVSPRRRIFFILMITLILLTMNFMKNAWAKEAKYVFLMIGDGMALTQRNAAEIFLSTQKSISEPGIVKLSMNDLPIQGFCTTYSTNSIITDSAAAGTALATGKKTKSGVISMDPSGATAYKTVAERAKDKGMKVGIISSVSIEHATPACFYGHEPTRKNYYELALQIPKSNFDYFAGGGFKKPRGADGDEPFVIDIIREAGYKIVSSKDEFKGLKKGSGKILAINPVLKDGKAMPYSIDKRDDSISLADFTLKGIEVLENPEGFFMMVEGGKIDWACHANDARTSIEDTLAFDKAVKVALDFYTKHPDETLLVVTGDHETGGMTIGFAGTKYSTFFKKLEEQNISYEEFDLKFKGFKDSTNGKGTFEDFYPTIRKNFGIAISGKNAISSSELKSLKRAFKEAMRDEKSRQKSDEDYLLYGGYNPLSVTITHILNKQSGIAWTTYSHTGVPVPVSAIGVGQESFNGYYDNTDVHKKITHIMGFE